LWLDEGLVALWTFTSPQSTAKPWAEMITAIDAVLAEDGAALTVADLSAYTDYSGE
jgi:hypothetical protein